MQFSIGFVYDVLLLLLFVLVAASGLRQGFLAGLVRLAGAVAAIVGGNWFAKTYAAPLYDKYIGTTIGEKVAAAVAEQGADLPALLAKYAAFLPETARNSIVLSLQSAGDAANSDLAARVVAAMQPVVLPFLTMLLFLLAVAVLRAVVQFLVRLLRGLNGLPVRGTFNKMLGLVFGIVIGTLDCWLVCRALWMAASATGGRIDWLSTSALSQSVLYSFFSRFNPLLMR